MNKEKIEELSLEEKIALLSGTNYMLTNQIFRLDISSVCHADGPHGLRKSLKGGKNLFLLLFFLQLLQQLLVSMKTIYIS